MIILDILFKICMASFLKYEDKARLVAIVWLAPILTLVLLGALNVLFYWLRTIIEIRFLLNNTFLVAAIMTLLVVFVLQRIYLKDRRPLGDGYPQIVGLLIPVMIIGSLVLYVMSFRYT